jgi:hypothetical protein
MKNLSIMGILIFCLLTLAACSSQYRMMLKDGSVIMMDDEPEFNHRTGFYEYKTLDGKNAQVNKDEVVEIKEL